MSFSTSIVLRDIRHIFRDQTLIFFLLLPFFQFALLKYGVPPLISAFPIVEQYLSFITFFGAMQVAIMFGVIASFLFLEEKDEGLIPVLRTLPISGSNFLLYRLLILSLLTVFGAYLMIQATGLVEISYGMTLVVAVHIGLWVPIIMMSLGALADNKVQGMAYFKGVNLVMLLGVLVYIFPAPFQWFGAFLPLHWTFGAYNSYLAGTPYTLQLTGGTAFHLILLYALGKYFLRKIW